MSFCKYNTVSGCYCHRLRGAAKAAHAKKWHADAKETLAAWDRDQREEERLENIERRMERGTP